MGLVLGVREADGVVDRVGLTAGLGLLLDLHGVGGGAQVDDVDLVRHEGVGQALVRVELLDLDVHVQLVGEPVEVHVGVRLAVEAEAEARASEAPRVSRRVGRAVGRHGTGEGTDAPGRRWTRRCRTRRRASRARTRSPPCTGLRRGVRYVRPAFRVCAAKPRFAVRVDNIRARRWRRGTTHRPTRATRPGRTRSAWCRGQQRRRRGRRAGGRRRRRGGGATTLRRSGAGRGVGLSSDFCC